ncbi:MAG: hypothetical protein WCZ90_12885 [Melioribacteraceae bacterium]
MNLIELSKYLNDEAQAKKYLLENGILKNWTHCTHCNSDKIARSVGKKALEKLSTEGNN